MPKFINKYLDKIYIVKGSGNTIIDGKVVYRAGKSAQFRDGELSTEDPEVIEALRKNIDFGVTLTEVEETTVSTDTRTDTSTDGDTETKAKGKKSATE